MRTEKRVDILFKMVSISTNQMYLWSPFYSSQLSQRAFYRNQGVLFWLFHLIDPNCQCLHYMIVIHMCGRMNKEMLLDHRLMKIYSICHWMVVVRFQHNTIHRTCTREDCIARSKHCFIIKVTSRLAIGLYREKTQRGPTHMLTRSG